MVFPGGSVVKKLPAKQETRATSTGQEDLPEKETATYSSILTWEILRIEEPVGYSHRVGHDLVSERACVVSMSSTTLCNVEILTTNGNMSMSRTTSCNVEMLTTNDNML